MRYGTWRLAMILVFVSTVFGCAGNIPIVDKALLAPPKEFSAEVKDIPEEQKPGTPEPGTVAQPEAPAAKTVVMMSKEDFKKRVKKTPPPVKKEEDPYIPRNFKPAKAIAFPVGERVQYIVTWLGMKAGLITMEVRQPKMFQSHPVFYFWGNIISSSLVNYIYRVDDSIDALLDMETGLPLRGSFDLNESLQVKQRIVLYQHALKKAQFWSKRVSEKKGNEEIKRTDEMLAGAQEMFSALYYLRMMKPQKGKTLALPIYENGKNWNLQVEGLDNETVNTPLGDINCVKTRLKVSVDGVLKQTGDVFGWFAESEQSELVKFSADIRIGSIKGILLRRGHISEPLDKSM